MCVGIAGPSGQCAPHAAGYRQHDGAGELRCDNCRKVIRGGEWYQQTPETLHHAKACTTHPDVVKEREKSKAATA
jgi:hypothetical protein